MTQIIPNTQAVPQVIGSSPVVINGSDHQWLANEIIRGLKVIHVGDYSFSAEETGGSTAELKLSLQRDLGSGWESMPGEGAAMTFTAGQDRRFRILCKVPYYNGIDAGVLPKYRLLAECPTGQVTLHAAEGNDGIPSGQWKSEYEFEGDEPVEIIEEDDFTGDDGTAPVNWDVTAGDPGNTSLINNNKLRHVVPNSAPNGTGVSSSFSGAVYPGNGTWAVQIDFDIVGHWFSTQSASPLNFLVTPTDASPGYHGISIFCHYDEYPQLTIEKRSSVSGNGNANNVSDPVSGTLQISANSGDLVVAYPDIGWSVSLPGELDAGKNYKVTISTNRANSVAAGDPSMITDYDNFTSTGGIAP